MRQFGSILLVLGVLGFFYCSSRLSTLDPVPPDTGLMKSLEYPAGQWETGKYACAGVGLIGILMTLFPKGR